MMRTKRRCWVRRNWRFQLIAEVLVFRGVASTYSYGIPDALDGRVTPGVHVDVPLGHGKCEGLVMAVTATSTLTVRPIRALTAKKPIVPPDLLHLITFLATQYLTTPFKAYQTIMGARKLREIKPPVIDENPSFTSERVLLREQQHVLDTIGGRMSQFGQFLIHGVTASGKTEVYMRLAQAAMTEGRSALILLPEIALTPQFTAIFEARFGSLVSVVHSGLTPKSRDIEWMRAYLGHAKVILGPRSAVFSPVPHLGLIIIDEEHEGTYKQDQHPRYYTHTLAAERARKCDIPLVLGSATPRIESVSDPTITVLKMTQRVNAKPMPKVTLVDLKAELRLGRNSPISQAMTTAITDCLSAGQKAMLLINRRGYAPWVACRRCGEVLRCDQCDLSFTFHQDQIFRCHRCFVSIPVTHNCPSCKKPALGFSGIGTQKVEALIQELFPKASIFRLDRDTSKSVGDITATLQAFRKSGDILIGTQMIAKGHDFPEVTMVGVLGTDSLLGMPDFRSPERVFQLVTQVAGRAGRGKDPGVVIVQSHQPEHYALQFAAEHDFDGFSEKELGFRKAMGYPPYSKIANLIFSHLKQELVVAAARAWSDHLGKEGDPWQRLGPMPAPVEKIQNVYRWHLLLKYSPEAEPALRERLLIAPRTSGGVRVIPDFDPRTLL